MYVCIHTHTHTHKHTHTHTFVYIWPAAELVGQLSTRNSWTTFHPLATATRLKTAAFAAPRIRSRGIPRHGLAIQFAFTLKILSKTAADDDVFVVDIVAAVAGASRVVDVNAATAPGFKPLVLFDFVTSGIVFLVQMSHKPRTNHPGLHERSRRLLRRHYVYCTWARNYSSSGYSGRLELSVFCRGDVQSRER